jgi:hypothetical protein
MTKDQMLTACMFELMAHNKEVNLMNLSQAASKLGFLSDMGGGIYIAARLNEHPKIPKLELVKPQGKYWTEGF